MRRRCYAVKKHQSRLISAWSKLARRACPALDAAVRRILTALGHGDGLGFAAARCPAGAVAVAFADREGAAGILEPQDHLAAAAAFLQRLRLGAALRAVVCGIAIRSAAR